MLKTLDRYQKCSYGAVEVSKPAKELEVATILSFIMLFFFL
jgi:MADS-box transcription factor